MLRRILKVILLWQEQGFCAAFTRAVDYFNSKLAINKSYHKWIKENENDILKTEPLSSYPLISIIVPVYNIKAEILIECIESVLCQTVKNWEICVVDDCSTMPEVKAVLRTYENMDKVHIIYRQENGHISLATNDGLKIAAGEFIGLLDCDDRLSPNAIFEVTKKLNEKADYDFIYSDEDILSENGKYRYNPMFKPEWSPDTFMSMMYTCHFAVYRRKLVEQIGGFRKGYEGAQDYDFTLRFVEQTEKIGHISKILYHWRARKESTVGKSKVKDYAYIATEKAKKDALERRGLCGRLIWIENILQYRVEYIDKMNPLISIIIPSRDNYDLLKCCIESIIKNAEYARYEVIVVDNGSSLENRKKCDILCKKYKCKYVYKKETFNYSKMCNTGAEIAQGDYILFLNDDIEVLTKNFLRILQGHASLAHIGAVGAKLLYTNSEKIQHVGIVNFRMGPGHCYRGLSDKRIFYGYRNVIDSNFIAVTGACLMIKKSKFFSVGKFYEELPVAYNDVDLCFGLIEKGYYNVVRNDVKLYHYESISRGHDENSKLKQKRQSEELHRLYERHPGFIVEDPFFPMSVISLNIRNSNK